MRISRRTVLATTAAAVLARPLFAQPRPVISVRRDASTAQGQADLEKYARAVAIMMAMPPSDPRSWTYQWYIHSVPSDRTKASELQRHFGANHAGLALANETWSTCQSHFPGMNSDNFLPWHRMYLMCFETTVRSVLNDSRFALPYWNYLDPAQRALPIAFRSPTNPTLAMLHRLTRNDWINAGQVIDGGNSAIINDASLSSPSYRRAGVHSGFGAHIDANLHGTVHVQLGNGRGMGRVPWAANDPIFWLHHANIDRLWASWNANGGKNPQDAAWLERTFAFPNGTGGRAVMTCGQVTSLEAAGYGYDQLQSGPTIVVSTAGQAQRPVIVLDASPSTVAVPPQGARITLLRQKRPKIIPVAGARLFVVLSDLSAPDTPGVVYRVELRDRQRKWVPIGFINFFEAVAEGSEHAGHSSSRQFTFDVTEIAAGMGGRPEFRVIPEGVPENGVTVTIGRVEFVQN